MNVSRGHACRHAFKLGVCFNLICVCSRNRVSISNLEKKCIFNVNGLHSRPGLAGDCSHGLTEVSSQAMVKWLFFYTYDELQL